MTEPLFEPTRGRDGPIRRALDARIAQLGAAAELNVDLALVVRSLADRIDDANTIRASRGFVQLTAEYRAARRNLFGGTEVDPFEVALAEFRAAEGDHPPGPVWQQP